MTCILKLTEQSGNILLFYFLAYLFECGSYHYISYEL